MTRTESPGRGSPPEGVNGAASGVLLRSLTRQFSRDEERALRAIQRLRARPPPTTPQGRWIVRSSIPEALGRYLFALVRAGRPRICVELGTGVGFSTLYLLAALALNRRGALWSLEGDPQRLALARQHIAAAPWHAPCHLVEGPFHKTLLPTLNAIHQVDLVFVDGAHQQATVLDQFPQLLRVMRPGGVLVYDDIRWSAGMRQAWRQIRSHRRVALSADCGRFGILFTHVSG